MAPTRNRGKRILLERESDKRGTEKERTVTRTEMGERREEEIKRKRYMVHTMLLLERDGERERKRDRRAREHTIEQR